MTSYSCFKAYDIRGKLGAELNADIARRIGRAFAEGLGAKRVVLGQDCRASSRELAQAVAEAYFAQREKLGFPGLKQRPVQQEAAA